jgi:tetratricopeptide (TPR) repeat protein
MEKKSAVADSRKHNVISFHQDATFFFEKAVQSLDRFHYDKALKYFRRAVEFEPDNPVNHCNMAGILSEMGNYEESNAILQYILNELDPHMTECYFYMANNFANMENFEAAEQALIDYLERDPDGQFLDESEEMMEFLRYELERPARVSHIRSREGVFEHDKARALLEEGKFAEATKLLENLVRRYPDFVAARNNLALAYYYMGSFDKAMETVREVLELDNGNLHALCNLAIFYQHLGDEAECRPLTEQLIKVYPFHQEHVFKLATTMGILGRHDLAYRHFRRLLKHYDTQQDPYLFHCIAVAAYNTGRFQEARRMWRQAEKLDPASGIPRFYLEQLDRIETDGRTVIFSYHYHLPFEEQFRRWEKTGDGFPEHIKQDPLIRSSFFWALRHGDAQTKLQVIQALGMIADGEVKEALLGFLLEPDEDDYLKKVAIFVLRSMGVKEPVPAVLGGEPTNVNLAVMTPNLPVWEDRWQQVMELAMQQMKSRYDIVQQHDMQTLWVDYLSRVFPEVKIVKAEGWAAALEYLTAKMHRRPISYHQVAQRYGISISTVSKCVKAIDDACGIKEKMNAIFQRFTHPS